METLLLTPTAREPDPFSPHLPLIESVVRFVARRRRLAPDEPEDFAATVHLRLIENDYAALRKFQGRSSLRTFLVIVINRMFLDYRIAQWGKWRPSVRARRLVRWRFTSSVS